MMIPARWPNMCFDQRFDKSVWAVAGQGSRYGTMVDPALAATGVDFTGATATLNVGSWQTWRRTVRDHRRRGDSFQYDQDLSERLKSKRYWAGFDRYYLSGKLDALDVATEWHLDRDGRTLYLWVPDGTNPAGHKIEAKTRDYAFEANRKEYLELAGFHFFAATLKLDQCNHCVVDGCHLRFPTWAHGNDPAPPTLIDGAGNAMRNSSAVYSDGPAVLMKGENNTLENCLFHDVDWHGLDKGHGVDLGRSDESVVRRCTIFNAGSSEGLVVPWKGPSLVEYNYVHHAGLVQSDGALIQSAGVRLGGTVILYNWVHDHHAFNWGGNGIRGDDLSRNLAVHHNVVWNCSEKGIVVKGDHNRVLNNTCLDNPTIDILTPGRPEPFKPWATFQHPHLLKKQNVNTHIANNCAGTISGTFKFERPQTPPLGKMENNYRDDEPKLTDPAQRDFRPRAGSPLIDAGRPIEGVTDGFKGKAPDIGAYEHGMPRWVPGYRNYLWVLSGEKPATIDVLLAMPVVEPVVVSVAAGAGTTRVEPAKLKFTVDNWMQPQTVAVHGKAAKLPVRFVIAHFDFDETLDAAAVDRINGEKRPFRTIR